MKACVALALTLYIFILPLSAYEYDFGTLKEYVPSDVLEYISDDAFSKDLEKSSAAVSEMAGFSYIIKLVLNTFAAKMGEVFASFSGIFGILVLGSAARILCKEDNSAFDMLSSLCVAALVFGVQYKMIDAVEVYLGELTSLMVGVLPMMSALYAAGGNLTSASVSANGMMLFLSFCETVCVKILLPTAKICYALSLARLLCKNVNISSMIKLINKTVIFVLGFVSTLVAALLSYQSVLAQGADTAASKIVKFSLGSLVPVVGGAIGDTVKTLFSGMILIKNTLGVFGVILIFMLVLAPITKLFLNKFLIGISSALATLLGASREEAFLSDMAGVQNLLIAICAFSALLFVVALGVFIRTAPAMGV